jgi:crossover junction endodeoxyribonuclease RuvC
VDTSLRSTGLAVVELVGTRHVSVYSGRVRNAPDLPRSACLLNIQRTLETVIAEHQPVAAAIESVFLSKNFKTTLILGEARGAVIAQCARSGLPVYEYEPRRVKQAVTGVGSAQKEQVQRMVQNLLALPALPQSDEADAAALAICHLHNQTRLSISPCEPL